MNFNRREKLIKDSVHGYIYIDEEYFKIIDTALFQRLKNVKQTSYVSLYPSSTHDRFTHSLGTYYLGKQVITGLWNNIGDSVDYLFSKDDKEEIIFTFEMACLLHDVGHAPFSHTGENFYIVKKRDDSLENNDYFEEYVKANRIIDFYYLDGLLINELHKIYSDSDANRFSNPIMKTFLADYGRVLRGNTAKPHEKMSALIGLNKLSDKIENISQSLYGDKIKLNADLFVRCIIGAKYEGLYRKEQELQKYSFYNAIISLLNSDIIDVDKLDYILRDSYMTGYENAGIDIERLIKSFTISVQDDYCLLAYKKNALSVIENVVRANDSSRRWVQNHPIILYDMYITQKCVSEAFKLLQEELGDKESSVLERFFSMESLSLEGNEWASGEYVLLASDLDVIALIKRAYIKSKDPMQKELFEEFFSRDKRRHPLWKSEAEYKECFDVKAMKQQGNRILQMIDDAIVVIESRKDKWAGVGEYVFTESTYAAMMGNMPIAGRRFLNTIRDYFRSIGKPMDIAILTARSFSSKIKKLNKNSVNVLMPDYNPYEERRIYSYSELVNVEDTSSDKMIFYIYSKHDVDTKHFITYLFNEGKFEDLD